MPPNREHPERLHSGRPEPAPKGSQRATTYQLYRHPFDGLTGRGEAVVCLRELDLNAVEQPVDLAGHTADDQVRHTRPMADLHLRQG